MCKELEHSKYVCTVLLIFSSEPLLEHEIRSINKECVILLAIEHE